MWALRHQHANLLINQAIERSRMMLVGSVRQPFRCSRDERYPEIARRSGQIYLYDVLVKQKNGAPRRRQSVPHPGSRRYADAPSATLLTGLGAGEWSPAKPTPDMPIVYLK